MICICLCIIVSVLLKVLSSGSVCKLHLPAQWQETKTNGQNIQTRGVKWSQIPLPLPSRLCTVEGTSSHQQHAQGMDTQWKDPLHPSSLQVTWEKEEKKNKSAGMSLVVALTKRNKNKKMKWNMQCWLIYAPVKPEMDWSCTDNNFNDKRTEDLQVDSECIHNFGDSHPSATRQHTQKNECEVNMYYMPVAPDYGAFQFDIPKMRKLYYQTLNK